MGLFCLFYSTLLYVRHPMDVQWTQFSRWTGWTSTKGTFDTLSLRIFFAGYDELAGVFIPVVDPPILVKKPRCLKPGEEPISVSRPVGSSRYLCGSQRGQIPFGSIVQGPPPERQQVPERLRTVYSKFASELEKFRMPTKFLMRLNPSHHFTTVKRTFGIPE